MAATEYPTSNTVVYGAYAFTGYYVQSYDLTNKTAVVAEVTDETGKRVAVRYDDQTTEGTLEMVVNGGAEPVPGDTLTYNSVKYEVTEVAVKGSNKDFVKVSVKLKKSEAVSLA